MSTHDEVSAACVQVLDSMSIPQNSVKPCGLTSLQKELAKEFARQAKMSPDNNSVQVGRYTAEKVGAWFRFSRLFMLNADLGTAARWEITEPYVDRAGQSGKLASYSRVGNDSFEEIIVFLALKEAEQHIAGQDRHKALAKEPQAKPALF